MKLIILSGYVVGPLIRPEVLKTVHWLYTGRVTSVLMYMATAWWPKVGQDITWSPAHTGLYMYH